MTTSTLQLPADFVSNILAQATALLTSFGNYIALIIGILLALVAIEFLISAIRK
jgi:hypothetical protein